LKGRQAEEYERLRDLSVNREVRAMQSDLAERVLEVDSIDEIGLS
jgi:hypothetical protein